MLLDTQFHIPERKKNGLFRETERKGRGMKEGGRKDRGRRGKEVKWRKGEREGGRIEEGEREGGRRKEGMKEDCSTLWPIRALHCRVLFIVLDSDIRVGTVLWSGKWWQL